MKKILFIMMLFVSVFITGCDAKDSNDSYEGTYQTYNIKEDTLAFENSYILVTNKYYISYTSETGMIDINVDEMYEYVEQQKESIKMENYNFFIKQYFSDVLDCQCNAVYEYKDMGDGYIYVYTNSTNVPLMKYTDGILLYVNQETYAYLKKIN